MRIIKSLLIFISVLFFASCVKDKPSDPIVTPVNVTQGHRVYVSSEGNFNANNAAVTIYQPSSMQLVADYYKSQNNNAVLGDVCQSIIKSNNNFYMVINNSGKIVVVDEDNFKLKGTITGFTSPRYILPVSFQKAYVSDLYSNSVSIIDLNTLTKTGSFALNGWTEKMELLYNKAFISNMRKNYTYVVNTVNNQITDSINVGINAGSLVIDKNDKLWILSSGDYANNIPAKLTRVDAITLTPEVSLSFSLPDSPGNLCINATKDTMYFINKSVYQMPIVAGTIPTTAFITSTNNNYYAIGVNTKDHTIYLSDAIDFVQKSAILVYTPQGQFRTLFKAGINSSGFYFE